MQILTMKSFKTSHRKICHESTQHVVDIPNGAAAFIVAPLRNARRHERNLNWSTKSPINQV